MSTWRAFLWLLVMWWCYVSWLWHRKEEVFPCSPHRPLPPPPVCTVCSHSHAGSVLRLPWLLSLSPLHFTQVYRKELLRTVTVVGLIFSRTNKTCFCIFFLGYRTRSVNWNVTFLSHVHRIDALVQPVLNWPVLGWICEVAKKVGL